jgi:uncharacterized membrane protein/mono/diheme cytochrome c family protein
MYPILLQSSDWALFIGRFHPILVHLPIGFLLIAAVFEVMRRFSKADISEHIITVILLWSAVGATLACVAGYLLSMGGGYDADLLTSHMWKGIGVAALAWIAWLSKVKTISRNWNMAATLSTPLLLAATLLTFIAGHDGGSLTHGEGYLTQHTPEPFRSLAGMPPQTELVTGIKPIADVQKAIIYQDIIKPMLAVTCTQCHGTSKQKGDLRLDNLKYITKGGKNGPVIVNGNSAKSELIKRCLLPVEDEKHMSPKGKPQLSSEQLALLAWWIDQGAPEDKKVAELQITDAIKPALASLGTENADPAKSEVADLPEIKVSPADPKALEAIKKVNLLVSPLASNQNRIEISAVNAPGLTDQQVMLLKQVAEQITWLKLSGTAITDAALNEIGNFKNLNKLHLENTAITDHGMNALKNMPTLQYINLVGTKVTDAGLKQISSLKNIRSIYVWQSAVTLQGIEQIRKEHPGIQIIDGMNQESVAAFVKLGSGQN